MQRPRPFLLWALLWALRLVLLLLWTAPLTSQAAPKPELPELKVDFLDVGQGDAALITTPSGKTVLIDGGPQESAARLSERLSRLPSKQGKLDLILLTHQHADHLGGLARVLSGNPGARVFMDALRGRPSPLYTRLLRTLQNQNVEVRNAVAGRSIDLGDGVSLLLLGPPNPEIRGTRSDVNANSVVARLTYGKVSVLFCGDAEAEEEQWLLRSGALLRSSVVKVPHHGSRYSSTPAFVAAVRPEAAVVSVGKGNRYGHPQPESLRRWEAVGARIYRTDRDGEIELRSDGNRMHFTLPQPTSVREDQP